MLYNDCSDMRRVNQYVTQGRIPGVERFGHSWAIPENAKKPEDPRKKRKKVILYDAAADAPPCEKFKPYFPTTGIETRKLITEVIAGIPFVSVVTDRGVINHNVSIRVQSVDRGRDIRRRVFAPFCPVNRGLGNAGNSDTEFLFATFELKIRNGRRNMEFGLDSGADDYLAKPFGMMEMVSHIKAVLRRAGNHQSQVLSCGIISMDENKHIVRNAFLNVFIVWTKAGVKRRVVQALDFPL